jgi:hypothetical protein
VARMRGGQCTTCTRLRRMRRSATPRTKLPPS